MVIMLNCPLAKCIGVDTVINISATFANHLHKNKNKMSIIILRNTDIIFN